MKKRTLTALLLPPALGTCLFGCAGKVGLEPSQTASEKLHTVVIEDKQLSGSPKAIVAQLNRLSKKYDTPEHKGTWISFDPAVDAECCSMTIFRGGEALVNWVEDVCVSCRARYSAKGDKILIEVLPLSEGWTPNLEVGLTNGMAEVCRQFRSKKGQDRYQLGEQLFRMLPRSAIVWEKEVPMHHFVSYDTEQPSYKLYPRDVIALLGEPDRNVNNEKFYYSLRPGGDMLWELGVDFGKHDFVENPNLTGVPRK
jgi:hypothetical protein